MHMHVSAASTNSSTTSGQDTHSGSRGRGKVQARATPPSADHDRQAGSAGRSRRSQRTPSVRARDRQETKPVHRSLGITSPTEDKQTKDRLIHGQYPPPPGPSSLEVCYPSPPPPPQRFSSLEVFCSPHLLPTTSSPLPLLH